MDYSMMIPQIFGNRQMSGCHPTMDPYSGQVWSLADLLGPNYQELVRPDSLIGSTLKGLETMSREMEKAVKKAEKQSGGSVVDKETEWGVKLDVRHFKPEEVEVKVQDGHLTIRGKHEERSDEHGFISREFTRRYALPENIVLDKMASTLSENGVLAITAPKIPPQKPEPVEGEPQKIPIKFVDADMKQINGA